MMYTGSKLEKFSGLVSLENKNIRFAYITYDGSGDDGSIEGIYAFNLESAMEHMGWDSLPNDHVQELVTNIGPNWILPRTITEIKLSHQDKKLLEDFGYNTLSGIGDWYNNDGGYGFIVIDLLSTEYYIDAKFRYMSEQTEYKFGELF